MEQCRYFRCFNGVGRCMATKDMREVWCDGYEDKCSTYTSFLRRTIKNENKEKINLVNSYKEVYENNTNKSEEPIKDYNKYLNGMQKSMEDKIWFIDKFNNNISNLSFKNKINSIVDYGCADGTLIKYINQKYPNVFDFVGIDNNTTMIDIAKENTSEIKNINFYMPNHFYNGYGKCLNLSSVIHEVYSYCNESSISDFWDFVFNSKFEYIAIRDMGMSRIDTSKTVEDAKDIYDKISKSKLYQERSRLYGNGSYFSSTSNDYYYKKYIEFLLKYRYVENWDRESQEEYFPLDIEELILKVPTDKYKIVYFEHYTLPFLKEKVKEDFDIDLNIKTHYKMLLQRK